jgi:glycosyltransferase involved in cell wall biosynthesis
MKIVSLTVCRNEEWVLGLSLRAALQWVDHAVVLNHASTDRTGLIVAEIMEENPGRVTYLEEMNPGWRWITASGR